MEGVLGAIPKTPANWECLRRELRELNHTLDQRLVAPTAELKNEFIKVRQDTASIRSTVRKLGDHTEVATAVRDVGNKMEYFLQQHLANQQRANDLQQQSNRINQSLLERLVRLEESRREEPRDVRHRHNDARRDHQRPAHR